MELTLVLFASLVLLSFCRGGEWSDFCHGKPCPRYEVIEKNQDFERRLYVATEWITTKIEGTQSSDVVNANSKLKDYVKRQSDAGYTIRDDTWPALITVTPSQDFSMSWFVPPGTRMPENTDTLVTLQRKPEATVYVRVFSGTPSIQSGKDNANKLWNAMDENCTDLPTYTGAGYDSYFSLKHNNEIWIYADDISCKKDK